MSKEDDGGPAFPVNKGLEMNLGGMSLRDYFASHALVSFSDALVLKTLYDESQRDKQEPEHVIARHAYAIADAMLKARQG